MAAGISGVITRQAGAGAGSGGRLFRNPIFWGALLIASLLLAAYFQVFVKLATDWGRISDDSHGFLVPPFAAYLLWKKKNVLADFRPVANWAGVVLTGVGLLILLVGVFGVELFLQRISFVIVLTGLVLCFGGRRFVYELRFVLLVLLLGIPIPAIIFTKITLPLQMLASQLACGVIPIFHIPVLREGNIIELPSRTLEVAEACSGIRSLISLLTIAIVYGFFFETATWRRVVLALASIPIAIAANAVRLVATAVSVEYWDPDKAMGFFHEFSGWVVFLVALISLLVVHRLLLMFPRNARRA